MICTVIFCRVHAEYEAVTKVAVCCGSQRVACVQGRNNNIMKSVALHVWFLLQAEVQVH